LLLVFEPPAGRGGGGFLVLLRRGGWAPWLPEAAAAMTSLLDMRLFFCEPSLLLLLLLGARLAVTAWGADAARACIGLEPEKSPLEGGGGAPCMGAGALEPIIK
jgi:hypothetical protein